MAMAQAVADTAVGWVDFGRDSKPSFANGYCHSSDWEAWSFSQPTFPIYEIGKLEVVDKQKNSLTLSGAYLSHWAKTGQTFAEPFAIRVGQLGNNWSYKIKYGVYLPLDGGSFAHFSDEMSIVKTVDKKNGLQLGVAGKFYDEEGAFGFVMAGPIVRLKFNETTVALRYSPFGNGPNQARVEFSTNF